MILFLPPSLYHVFCVTFCLLSPVASSSSSDSCIYISLSLSLSVFPPTRISMIPGKHSALPLRRRLRETFVDKRKRREELLLLLFSLLEEKKKKRDGVDVSSSAGVIIMDQTKSQVDSGVHVLHCFFLLFPRNQLLFLFVRNLITRKKKKEITKKFSYCRKKRMTVKKKDAC